MQCFYVHLRIHIFNFRYLRLPLSPNEPPVEETFDAFSEVFKVGFLFLFVHYENNTKIVGFLPYEPNTFSANNFEIVQ